MESSGHIINYNISHCVRIIMIINISEERLHLKVLKYISAMFLNLSILFTAEESAFMAMQRSDIRRRNYIFETINISNNNNIQN